MAKREVTGKTKDGLAELRDEFESDDETFSEAYCLAKIPRQPEDYEGPDRYCTLRRVCDNGRCKFHGGHANTENLDPLAAMTHGMNATEEHLIEDFSEADQELYDWIKQSFTDAYDLDPETDPLVSLRLHQYAVEVVRNERGEDHLMEEGERRVKPKVTPSGELIENEKEYSEHYLAGMIRRHHQLLMDMEDSLGVSLQSRREEKSADGLAGTLQESISGVDEDYEPTRFEPENK